MAKSDISVRHPKEIQTVMRHSNITLTMDTYGHLFPGQESETVNKLQSVFLETPTAEKATGTDALISISAPKSAAHAQRAGC